MTPQNRKEDEGAVEEEEEDKRLERKMEKNGGRYKEHEREREGKNSRGREIDEKGGCRFRDK